MLDTLFNPVVLAVVAVVLVALIVLLLVINRRRAQSEDVLPPPELGAPIDYTALEASVDEPTTWSERIRGASPATKLLLVLLPLVLVATLAVIYFGFLQPGPVATVEPTPEIPPPEINQPSAIVASPERIVIQAQTNLPNNTLVTASMLENGQAFDWFSADAATTQVSNNQIRMTLTRRGVDAPTPSRDEEYAVVLAANLPDGSRVAFDPIELEVPAPNQAGFFQTSVAVATPLPQPTAAPTPQPTPATTPEPTLEPTPEPTTYTATVRNGGRVRSEPQINPANLDDNVLDMVNAFETVQLLERTADGQWYRIINEREVVGWVSATLLTVEPDVAAVVPIQGQTPQPTPTAVAQTTPQATVEATSPTAVTPTGLTATVRNGGRVRSEPRINPNNLDDNVLDMVNAFETVQLLERTANGQWYRIINIRNVDGWVSATLLTVEPDVAAAVPVAQQ